MPIKDPSVYPADWQEISYRIRHDRAGNRCECTGQCGKDHWFEQDTWHDRCDAEQAQPHPITESKVVLTVAHLDHNSANNDDDNLLAMCQRCHLTYDAAFHAKNAAETRRQNKIDAGQMELPL